MKTPFYKRSLNGNILTWDITSDTDNNSDYIVIITGKLGGKLIHFVSPPKYKTLNDEIQARKKEKLDEGWVEHKLEYDNLTEKELYTKLNLTLPHHILKDMSGRRNPQRGVYYNKNYATYPGAIQAKLNGLRCTLEWGVVEDGIGMFKTSIEKAVLKSSDGVTYVLPHITDNLTKDLFVKFDDNGNEIMVTYDGELYIPGQSLTYIRSSVPYIRKDGVSVKASNPSNKVSFYCFDLAIEDYNQIDRLMLKDAYLSDFIMDDSNTYINAPIINLKTHIVETESEAFAIKDMFLKRGYEGAMFRNFNYKYQFGKKNKCMLKLKVWLYTECLVLDIIEKNSVEISNNKRTYIAFVLKNDINNNVFECTPDGDEETRVNLLKNKHKYINTLVEVKFRERSETGEFPFQSVVKIKKSK